MLLTEHLRRRRPRRVVADAARVARAHAYLRLKGVEVGSMPYLRGLLPLITNAGRMLVADDFRSDGLQFRSHLHTGPGALLELGDHVFVNRGVTISASEHVRLGNNVFVGDLSAIFDSNFHEIEPGQGVTVDPVDIGHNVWLGRAAIVLPGVKIGRDCVVAAGSVVTRSVPAGHMVGGNPARLIRELDRVDAYERV